MAQWNSSRDATAHAFIDGTPYRGSAAMFTDGRTVWSYGEHYAIAERGTRDDCSVYGVNELNYSNTTNQHRGAVKRALESAGFIPTKETYIGSNGHTFRVWH